MTQKEPVDPYLGLRGWRFLKVPLCLGGLGRKKIAGRALRTVEMIVENQWDYDVRRGRFVEFHSMVWFWAPAVDRTGVQPFSEVIS